jgi:hypothetical protein
MRRGFSLNTSRPVVTTFDMRVIGISRNPRAGAGHCPLTAEVEKLIDVDVLGRMKPSAYLLNAVRGHVVDGAALVDALARSCVALDGSVSSRQSGARFLHGREHIVLVAAGLAGDMWHDEHSQLPTAASARAGLLDRDAVGLSLSHGGSPVSHLKSELLWILGASLRYEGVCSRAISYLVFQS